ncbi:bi-domain-containing oxidoreductase [Pleionea sp. CnH1-48]|uniref:bi-domain-containing oxidoreductase n=1 Tax=Pleionea sp. CnH1-48 TaxID=2954494 RepID=UPI0020976530|nr:bi-domain-containing oxidoreductase [Pleionea sp. CnH1-48]
MIKEAPSPLAAKNTLLIDTQSTLVSVGTERMLVEFGKASMLAKAKQQPDKVKQVLEKVKTDGLMTTIDAVRSKLAQPLPLGYCNVGVVNVAGESAENFKAGDRVVSNGPHADVVRVSKNLCAKIPDGVSDEEAAFTVVASIGLQGIRLLKPTLGECFVVTGVGLIGLLTVQLLLAHGCRVLALDFDSQKLELAKSFGAEVCNLAKGEDPITVAKSFSRGKGVDGVIVTASTKSNEPISQAAHMCRKRGRIVLVGVTGLSLSRADFYEKELSFQVSCSYGPGRYDPNYEEKGQDYPYAFVRWTEQRNFEAVLDMMARGQLNVTSLITHRFDFSDAESAYQVLTEDSSALGIIINYSSPSESRHTPSVLLQPTSYSKNKPVVGFIGAGNYASRMLIPAFKKAGAQLHSISTSGGTSGVIHGEKAGFGEATTDTQKLLENDEINTVAIVTRHNSHAKFVVSALKTNKNIFVEKPLAITRDELDKIRDTYRSVCKDGSGPHLMVGFNRRFSPHIKKMKELLITVNEPKSFIITVNAGEVPSEHWVQDIQVGGGRIIGEACHFIDLMRHLAGSKILSVEAHSMGRTEGIDITEDKASISIRFEDGSFGTIHYFANGASSFPKERVEVFAAGKVLQLDNFRKMKGYGWAGFNKLNLWRQDKGHNECARCFLEAVELGMNTPITVEELFEVAEATLDAAEQIRHS